MVTYVTEFCSLFLHNVINATNGETAAVNIGYALEGRLGACRNFVDTLFGQLESSRFCFRSLRGGSRNCFRKSPSEHRSMAID
jgi:hypothetical protein